VSRRRVVFLLILGAIVLGAVLASRWFPTAVEPGYSAVGEWGGTGSGPGRLNGPIGIAVSGDEVFVSDSRNGRIQVFDLGGSFLRELPVPGAREGTRGRPMHIDVHGDRLYVPDYLGDGIVVMSLQGEVLARIGHSGSGPGEFDAPSAVAADDTGFLWVADFYNQRVQKLSPTGEPVSQLGVTRTKGTASGRFNYPTDLAFLKDGRLVVADAYNDRVQLFSSGGEPLVKWGGPFAVNIAGGANGWFRTAIGVGIGHDDTVFVADMDNDRVQKFSATGRFLARISHCFVKRSAGGAGDGGVFDPTGAESGSEALRAPGGEKTSPAPAHRALQPRGGEKCGLTAIRAGLDRPTDVAETPDGTVYVVDFGHDRIVRFAPVS